MDVKKNKKNKPSVGFYGEPGFVSLTSSLRKMSGDDTMPTDDYVDIYKNVYDLITPDVDIESGGVIDIVDIVLKDNLRGLKVYYANGGTKTIQLEDKYLKRIIFNGLNQEIHFIVSGGSIVTIDLDELSEKYFDLKYPKKADFEILEKDVNLLNTEVTNVKEEINTIQTEISEINKKIDEGQFDINVDELEERVEIIENTLDDGVENIKWKNF